jgi:hypothetical protein
MRMNAEFNLQTLDALDTTDALEKVVDRFKSERGVYPETLQELVRAGILPSVPKDPTGVEFAYNSSNGDVSIRPGSMLYKADMSGTKP